SHWGAGFCGGGLGRARFYFPQDDQRHLVTPLGLYGHWFGRVGAGAGSTRFHRHVHQRLATAHQWLDLRPRRTARTPSPLVTIRISAIALHLSPIRSASGGILLNAATAKKAPL